MSQNNFWIANIDIFSFENEELVFFLILDAHDLTFFSHVIPSKS